LLLSSIGLITIVVLINYLRHRGIYSLYEELNTILVAYLIGPFSAFSIWFQNFHLNELGLGENTFSCIFRILGLKEQSHGEFIIINGQLTNVYTVFKHLIIDYSYFGTIIEMAVIGFIANIIDAYVISNNRKAVGFSISIVSFILVSFFSSIFRYTTNIVAIFIIIAFPFVLNLRSFRNE